jgi:hypothetical protein
MVLEARDQTLLREPNGPSAFGGVRHASPLATVSPFKHVSVPSRQETASRGPLNDGSRECGGCGHRGDSRLPHDRTPSRTA